MEWRSIALKNTWRNLRRYLGYLLASVVAVTVFCMFALFIDNTAVQHGYMTQTAGELAVVCRVVVALFAIFFIFYFHAALMRMRNKEFGLLLTLGMTQRQVGWLIFNESLLLGVCALGIGCLLGIPASALFLWIMGLILALPSTLPFMLSANAFEVTLIFFGLLFLIEAVIISLRVTGRTPKMLILGARIRQMPPRASLWRVLLGLLCIGVAYDLAVQFSFFILLTMIPIIALTIIGTYYLFSQVSVLVLRYLRSRALDGKNLLVVARLSYRMRDYARMLTVVSTLSACVMTGMGAVFGVLQVTRTSAPIGSRASAEQLLSVMLFAGFFISCLFFLAAGCAIYFKLFSQQEEDRRQFQALERIGMQRHEVGWVLNIELLLLFFLPVLVGIIHSVFAMLDLINLLSFKAISNVAQSVLSAFGIICLLYGACFAVYYGVSLVSYKQRIYG